MSQEMKIHVIGTEDTVLGFGLIGISGTIVQNSDMVKQILERYANPKQYDLIIVNSQLLQGLEEFTDNYRLNSENPILFDIPDESGTPMKDLLREFVKKAFSV
jgi:vacuolar-type H+-ATPase subunit F/Vma7